MSVTVEMNFDLGRINLDFSKELNKAGTIIKRDHFQRLEKGQGVKGALKPSKKKNGKTLVRTGKMRNLVIEEATKQNQETNIHPGEKRFYPGTSVTMSDVGGFHQTGAGNLPVREWFGISKNAEKKSIKLMELRIEQEIRRA